jgi:16S rRNA (cytidine1402-2'-O)-methyltransferase
VLGDRKASLCRELTKKFEEVRRGTLSELLSGCDADPPRGEVVVVVDRGSATIRPGEMEDALRDALTRLSLKDAAREVAEALGLARRDVYQAALALHRDG